MLSQEELIKYLPIINESDSIFDLSRDLRAELGRDLTGEEVDQLIAIKKNGGQLVQIEPVCADIDVVIECRKEIEPTPAYDKTVRIKELADQLADTYRRKNSDYGDSFGISVHKYGIIAALTRMSDKWNRLENLILNRGKGAAVPCVEDESILDTLLDMATYALMTYMEIEKE